MVRKAGKLQNVYNGIPTDVENTDISVVENNLDKSYTLSSRVGV